jgi:hypothetical protein
MLGTFREDDLVQLGMDPLRADDVQAFRVALDGLESGRINEKPELRSEADGAQHPQRVVAEGDVRCQRCADDAALKVAHTFEGIDQLAAVSGIERDRQRIDGEVAPLLIVLDAARYHFRLAAVAAVALLARAHELHLDVAVA